MTDKLLQPLSDKIIEDVRMHVAHARHAALAVIEQHSGHPAVSRTAMATLTNGKPVLLTSALAPHTAALGADGRCSLLIGEIGKGDPMAHPRLTLFCVASGVPRGVEGALRERFLAHHPKAVNYIDLPDFGFWQLDVLRASYNAGFGKAYAISGDELILQG